MNMKYSVSVYASDTGNETVEDARFDASNAMTYAERLAEKLAEHLAEKHDLGNDGTRFEMDGWGRYLVLRDIVSDGSREEVAYVVTVEEQVVDEHGVSEST
jgi:hypothetical protein